MGALEHILQTLEHKRIEKGWSFYRLRKEAGIEKGIYEGWLTSFNPTARNLLKVINALGYEIQLKEK